MISPSGMRAGKKAIPSTRLLFSQLSTLLIQIQILRTEPASQPLDPMMNIRFQESIALYSRILMSSPAARFFNLALPAPTLEIRRFDLHPGNLTSSIR
jgi:hypothetical protein